MKHSRAKPTLTLNSVKYGHSWENIRQLIGVSSLMGCRLERMS
ncbi:MAG: hypothetical protein ACI9LX_004482 [Paraglaciecola sp.]